MIEIQQLQLVHAQTRVTFLTVYMLVYFISRSHASEFCGQQLMCKIGVEHVSSEKIDVSHRKKLQNL